MPGRRIFRSSVQWLFWPALVVLGLNIENLAIEWGWDKLLLRNWLPAIAILESRWFQVPAALIVGAELALSIDGRLRRGEAAKTLDNLYAEGVAHRNDLISPIPDFDLEADRIELRAWDERVLQSLRDAKVGIADLSRFRTLNLYEPAFHSVPGNADTQKYAESLWTEKLHRLQVIIGKLDD